MVLLLFLIGVFSWPLLEYILHRYSGHQIKFPAQFFKEHQMHHLQRDYFAPAWKKTLVALAVLVFLTFLNSLWLEIMEALTFSAGFIFMYLFYEWTHFAFHKYAPKTKLGLILRKHHFTHHFHYPKSNFGVTTIFIDSLLKTRRLVPVVSVPAKMPMAWLYNPSGQIIPKYKNDFKIQ